MATCKAWENKKNCTKRDLQSLLCSLLYISKCVRSSRVFLNRMLDLLRSADKQQCISITPDFSKDLAWFLEFTPSFNGQVSFNHQRLQGHIELDASLQGLGAYYNNQVYALPITLDPNIFGIVHLEMINILLAIRAWAPKWSGKAVLIHCDNMAVVSVLNTGKTQDMLLAAIARNIHMETAKNDINTRLIHILGKNNTIADSLSRFHTAPHF